MPQAIPTASFASSFSRSRGSPDSKAAGLVSPSSPRKTEEEEEEEERANDVFFLCQADEEDALVVVRPAQFKVFDVVLVSYDTLREEIWFSPPSPSSSSSGSGPATAYRTTPPQRLSTGRSFFSSSSSSLASPITSQATSTPTAKSLAESQAGAASLTRSSSFVAEEESVHRGKRSAVDTPAAAAGSSSSFGGGGLGLRREKKYRVLQSPLLQVHWWRLLIDEAQMVGGKALS